MSFFGLQSSEQRNITENYIQSAVNNASSNITENTLLTNQLAYAEVDFVQAGTLKCPHINITAVAKNENRQNIKVISETHTDYDTTLTNNITNTMKNAVKQKTPGLMESGLFSSQVNNQLNQAVNNTKNNISNKFFTKRKNMISTDQTGKSKVTLRNEGIIGCDGEGGTFDLRSEATNAVQTSFLLKTFDEESATSGISNTLTNSLSNVATQAGAGPFAAIIALALFGCVYIYKNSGDDELDKGSGSIIKDKIPRNIRVIILFIGLNIIIGFCIYVLVQDDSYEIDNKKLTCDRSPWWDFFGDDDNYKLKPEFDEDRNEYNEDIYNYCSNLKKNTDEWGDIRQESNFSATSTDINDSVETFNGTQQYNRINDSKSLRGTIRELNDEGQAIDVDYTSLKLDPYSDIDCGDDGLVPGTDTKKEGCRTIKEDFIWEELIKKSCGCCRCDPNKIGYMDEWVENTGNNCYLDNTRKIGDYCDKNIDVIQPGSGYDTGTDYDTICRNEKYENKKCKKKDASGSIVDLEDDDLANNIKVSLISETECKSFNNSLVPGGGCGNVGTTGDVLNGHRPGSCCYNELPGSQDWSSVTSALFGKNSGNECTESGLAETVSSLSTSLGICGPGCMKDDKCRVDYLNALRNESDSAAGQTRDMNSRKDDCDPDTCLYKVKGVQEIKVTTVPPNHIEDPDNIYTIKHKVPNIGSQFQQQHSAAGQPSSSTDSRRDALLAAGIIFTPEVVVAELLLTGDGGGSEAPGDGGGTEASPRETTRLNPVEFTHDGGIRNNADYLWQASSFIHFSNGLERDYGMDNYHVHIGDAECNQLPDDIDYDKDNKIGPMFKRPVNLCQCRFKRIPACIKNENGEYLENFGCPDDLGIDGSSCFECIDAKSGAVRRANYGTKLKLFTIVKLVISIIFYVVFSIWFMF